MKRIEINREDALEYMGCIGNISYLWHFISHFEKKIEDEISPFPKGFSLERVTSYPYGECPNFAAWVRLYAEAIAAKTLASISRAKAFKTKIMKLRYRDAINEIVASARAEYKKKEIAESDLDEMEKALRIVIELRHTLQHGSMPNILRKIKDKEVSIEDLALIMMPYRYQETRALFQSANKLLEMLPQPTIIGCQDGRTLLEKREEG